MVTALVFPRATPDLVREAIPPGATVIAVDAGAEALAAAGVRVDLVVGDMDSVRPETLARLEGEGARVIRHPSAKRDTDGAIALAHAKDDDLLFIGAGGGRVDHALANLHLLVAASRRARVRAVDADACTWVVTPDRPLELDLPAGATVSVLPFDARCEGVTYGSFEYLLDDATMEPGDPYGMSNVCGPPPQRVSLRKGTLLVIEPRTG